MKRIPWLRYATLLLTLSACDLEENVLPDRVCLPTSWVERNADEIETGRQAAGFNPNKTIAVFSEKRNGQDLVFLFSYQGSQALKATTLNNQHEVVFQYTDESRLTRAVYSVNAVEHSVFSLTYQNNRLIQLVETRSAASSPQLAIRTFQFEYDSEGTLSRQVVTMSYRDNRREEEEWVFDSEPSTRQSPYADLIQPAHLTILALTNPTGTNPARFLQKVNLRAYRRSLVLSNGRRSLENATFASEYNAFNHPIRRTVSTTPFVNGTAQAVKRSSEVFGYDCGE